METSNGFSVSLAISVCLLLHLFDLRCILRCYGCELSSFSLVARVECISRCRCLNTDHRQLMERFVATKIGVDFARAAEIKNFASFVVKWEETFLFVECSESSCRPDSAMFAVVSFRANVFCIEAIIDALAEMSATASRAIVDLDLEACFASKKLLASENPAHYNVPAIYCSSYDSAMLAKFSGGVD